MKLPILALAVLALVLAAGPASAQCPPDPTTTADDFTCYVSATTGNDANSGTNSSPLKTIQAALNQVAAGTELEFQIVRVLPGTYEECPFSGFSGVPGNVSIVADDFLTRGANTTTIIDGTTACIPDGLPVVELGDNSTLRGFTIKGGGFSGVAAYGHVTIANNIIEDSSSPETGGGIFLQTGSDVSAAAAEARIERNTIRNNTAVEGGGGIYIFAAGDGLPSRVVVDANTLLNNIAGPRPPPPAVSGDVFGGGIAVFTDSFSDTDRSEIVITNNTIEGNEAKGIDSNQVSYGGGLSVATFGEGTETVEVKTTNVVRNNKATFGYGGGIAALGQGSYPGAIAHDILVESNAVSGNTATFGGGGIHAKNLTLGLDDVGRVVVRVLSNELSGNGTSAAADQFGVRGGGGIFAEVVNEQTAGSANRLTVNGNVLRNNTSESFGGGASLRMATFGRPSPGSGTLPAVSRVGFANNLVTGNTALDTQTDDALGEGGGVYVISLAQAGGAASADLKFNTLADNTADVGHAGGAALRAINGFDPNAALGSTAVDVSNSIFLSNSGYAIGGDAAPGVENTTVRIAYNDTFDNGAGPFAPQYTTTAGPGNITVDPELDAFFVPLLCSPTIDAGDLAEGTRGGQGGLQEERQPNGSIANLGHTGLTLNSTVTLPDANGDALVDGVDVLRLATSFAAVSSNATRYNAAADLDKDGDVDGSDLSYMAAWFGKACP